MSASKQMAQSPIQLLLRVLGNMREHMSSRNRFPLNQRGKIRRQQTACWTQKMLLTSLPVTPPLTPPQGHHFRLLRGGGGSVIRRCAFASLAAPAEHRQHHLHHPHQRLPRMRMMQVMLGMLPMLEMKEGKGERISTGKGGKGS